MENVLINGKDVGKIVHNGSGMCVKVKDIILNAIKNGKKVVIINPKIDLEDEWKDIACALND